jgi:hypothetical protein
MSIQCRICFADIDECLNYEYHELLGSLCEYCYCALEEF